MHIQTELQQHALKQMRLQSVTDPKNAWRGIPFPQNILDKPLSLQQASPDTKHGTKRKAEDSNAESKAEKKAKLVEQLDFCDEKGDHVKFTDLFIISANGVKFYFHRNRFLASDFKVLKEYVRNLPDKKAPEIKLEFDSITVLVVLQYIYSGKAALVNIKDIILLASILRFAFRYSSESLTEHTIDAIGAQPLPWDWNIIETTLDDCKVPLRPLVVHWVEKIDSDMSKAIFVQGTKLSPIVCKLCLEIGMPRRIIPSIIKHVIPQCPSDVESKFGEVMLDFMQRTFLVKPSTISTAILQHIHNALWDVRTAYWSGHIAYYMLEWYRLNLGS